eukprot:TRINITY_DN3922_c1_g1_i1.p1 TRINITY_DN3922_c1_g1~~TRINITY_DN3922_c1_g1_i1.p1  ORF type:complete len:250 (-),score=-24.70 TRINITY_DN3922_c1_g1_i1:124-873(-)
MLQNFKLYFLNQDIIFFTQKMPTEIVVNSTYKHNLQNCEYYIHDVTLSISKLTQRMFGTQIPTDNNSQQLKYLMENITNYNKYNSINIKKQIYWQQIILLPVTITQLYQCKCTYKLPPKQYTIKKQINWQQIILLLPNFISVNALTNCPQNNIHITLSIIREQQQQEKIRESEFPSILQFLHMSRHKYYQTHLTNITQQITIFINIINMSHHKHYQTDFTMIAQQIILQVTEKIQIYRIQISLFQNNKF